MKFWAEMTWEEIDKLDRENTLLILPVGSTEQHGQRLPVETDAFYANYLAEKVAEEIENSVLLPTLNYGMSLHHTAFPGTISITNSAYELVIEDILGSVVRDGFHKILIVNGHGGNDKWIDKAISTVQSTFPEMTIFNPVIKLFESEDFKKLADEFGEDLVHAGAMETSQVAAIDILKIRPPTVVTEFPTGAKYGEGTESPEVWKEKFPKGQKGNQKKISLEKGEKVNEFIVAKLLEVAKKMME